MIMSDDYKFLPPRVTHEVEPFKMTEQGRFANVFPAPVPAQRQAIETAEQIALRLWPDDGGMDAHRRLVAREAVGEDREQIRRALTAAIQSADMDKILDVLGEIGGPL